MVQSLGFRLRAIEKFFVLGKFFFRLQLNLIEFIFAPKFMKGGHPLFNIADRFRKLSNSLTGEVLKCTRFKNLIVTVNNFFNDG